MTESGQYPLEPYATPNGGLPKALRIFKSTTGSANTYIYAEARTQYGADAAVTPGVLIHTGVDTDGTQIYLHDLVPSTSVTDFILDPGQSYTFSDDGLAHYADRALLRHDRRSRGRDDSGAAIPWHHQDNRSPWPAAPAVWD